MEEKLNGFVLSSSPYGENDRIINIFTIESGTVSAFLKGVKKNGAKLKFAGEPFAFCEYVLVEKNGKRTVTGATLLDSFYPVRENIVKFFCAGTVVEFVKRFAKENIVSNETFFLAINTLKELAYGDKEPKFVLTSFLIQALKLVGYALNTFGCFNCGKEITGRAYFDYVSGAFYCENCKVAQAKEINLSTFINIQRAERGEELTPLEAQKTLMLLNYYIINKAEENINSLKELLLLPQ